MGQALDRHGNVLGEATGDTSREVFEKLTREFKDASEIRIRTLEQREAAKPEDLVTAMLGMAERWQRESGTAGWQLGKQSCAQDLIALVHALAEGKVLVSLKFPETLPS
jgi:hypothetical protein